MIVYYGNSTSCTRYDLAPIDYAEALSRPDGAMWSTSPQASTLVDMVLPSVDCAGRVLLYPPTVLAAPPPLADIVT
jgi:hypothetical protein